MSSYKKDQEHYDYDYDPNNRPSQDSSYTFHGSQPTPSYEPHPSSVPPIQVSTPHGIPQARIPFLAPPYATPRDTGYPPPETYIPSRARLSFNIIDSGPYHGFAHSLLIIEVSTSVDLDLAKHSFYINFGHKTRLKAQVHKSFHSQPSHFYRLEVKVPDLRTDNVSMPLLIDFQDENAFELDHKSAGDFYYSSGGYPSYASDSRKRKFSEDASEYSLPNPKRSASQPLQPAKYKDSSTGFPVPQMPYSNPLFAIPAERPSSGRSYGQLSHRPLYGYGLSPNMAPQALKPTSPLLTSYDTYHTLKQASSPRMHASHRGSAMRRTSTAGTTPTWVRTTSQQQSSSRSSAGYGSTPQFNPYSQYPDSKAKLEIVGSLMGMCDDWSATERTASRRLVEFSRIQEGSKITASFRAVSPEDRSTHNPCVSCIYWARKKEYYVTSVDTIALLEGLVAVRFTVEEKNRIRRNLEGFKPYTVSKNKDECDDVFRLIMGFPAPKPRNIEKDIKVFPWAILELALKKIIGKYSASYASTSSLLGQSTSTGDFGVTMTEASEMKNITASPTHPGITIPKPYSGGMTSDALSPGLVAGSAGLDIAGSPHDLRGSSSMPHLYGQASWAHNPGPSGYNAPTYTSALATSAPARSWGLEAAYIESTSAGAGTGSGASGTHSDYYRASDDRHMQQPTNLEADAAAGNSRYMHHSTRQTTRS